MKRHTVILCFAAMMVISTSCTFAGETSMGVQKMSSASVKRMGHPICPSIFPEPELILQGEKMPERNMVYEYGNKTLTLSQRASTLYWTWERKAPPWFQSPDWGGPYHFESSYNAYCRHQGHGEWCATDCFVFHRQGAELKLVYQKVYYDGTTWEVTSRAID